MVPRVRFTFWFGFWFLFVAASGCTSPTGPNRSVVLRVSGTVASSATGSVLPGAEITVSSAGNFNLPRTVATTKADVNGSYSFQAAFSYREPCPSIWLTASAAGHVTSSPQDARNAVACNGEPQNITITLNPN